jgi:hypothetical protein
MVYNYLESFTEVTDAGIVGDRPMVVYNVSPLTMGVHFPFLLDVSL